jgi:hypothetical protein
MSPLPEIPTETHAGLPDLPLLATQPDAALGRLAEHLELVHRSMNPADVLELDLTPDTDGDPECLRLGRHEVPGLAMLFRRHRTTPEAERDALARAEAYLRNGRIVSGP